MKRLINKARGLILAGALGLSVLALAACVGGDSTNPAPNGASQGTASGLANLLNSTSGAAVYEQLLQGAGGSESPSTSGIWVNGQGEASAKPDLVLLSLGMEAFASTVAEARNDGAVAMGQVLDVLANQGVEERDIQTRFFNINARYTSQEVTRCATTGATIEPDLEDSQMGVPMPSSTESGVLTIPSVPVMELEPVKVGRSQECVTERERVLLGYEVSNQLSVKIRDIGAIGDVIDAVTDAGGNLIRFQEVSFTIEDDQALKDQARAAAVRDLTDKAEQVAALTGVALGDLVYITESSSPVLNQSFRSEGISFAQASAPTPIQVGELQVRVSLQAAFNINSSVN